LERAPRASEDALGVRQLPAAQEACQRNASHPGYGANTWTVSSPLRGELSPFRWKINLNPGTFCLADGVHFSSNRRGSTSRPLAGPQRPPWVRGRPVRTALPLLSQTQCGPEARACRNSTAECNLFALFLRQVLDSVAGLVQYLASLLAIWPFGIDLQKPQQEPFSLCGPFQSRGSHVGRRTL